MAQPEPPQPTAGVGIVQVEHDRPTHISRAWHRPLTMRLQHRVALDPAVVARIARVGDGRDGHDRHMMLRLLDRSSPGASADHVVKTFMHLGGPYNRIANPQDSFDLDFTDVHNRLLKILHSDNRISRGYPRVPTRRYSVTVS